ncbi:MAG: RIP metalloprotease RseP [Bacteroidia bacterium]|nr:RIP metalloprotease RseP [Bacteroidia bacterium]MBP9688203.1 RIP metalloprotease RseP [Bacteroidia bacterium]
MQGLIMAAQLIAGISILVILHELGHFWAARAFGIKVEKFYLFFDAWGKKLFSIKIGDTEYGIGWLPLGGYVKIAGMVDESMDTEQLEKPAEPWEFRSKPAWQRLIVMVAGVVMNIITGIIIFALLSYTYGEKYTVNSSLQYGVVASELAQESGFRNGDKLKSVNGKEIKYFENALSSDELLADVTIYTVERNGVDTQITLSKDFTRKFTSSKKAEFLSPRFTYSIEETVSGYPAEKAGLQKGDVLLSVDSSSVVFFDELQLALKNQSGKQAQLRILRGLDTLQMPIEITSDGKIGIAPNPMGVQYDSLKFGFLESFPKGVNKAYETIALQVKGWGKIFSGDIPANKAVQGPIGIAKYYGGEWVWSRFWLFTALISLGLAFMNILPIPALDGGHVVLLLIEMITGKPISTKVMERVQTVGMVILLTLMVLIFGNDIIGLFLK